MLQDHHTGIYGALLQEYNVSRLRKLNQERSARIAALKTREDAEKYILSIRQKIAASFAMPQRSGIPRTEVTGIVECADCRIEKIIYESRPGFPVTAHLILPLNFTGKLPAILFLCGHSQEGKCCSVYQTAARTLAANGNAVLVIDPVSQGERLQFIGTKESITIAGICTREHNMLGKQLWLCDEFFGSWRAHDALCGLDYLLSRPEIDPARVGVTGNSGGGTMTTFIQALDPRFTMAAPSCYVTSWQRNIENEIPADCEQIPPGILAAGCEMGDFVLAYAPRPILLLGQKNDFFDPRGLKETYEECRKVYALLGAEENLQLFIGPTNHGYSVENRFSMYKFFSAVAGTPEITAEADVSAPDAADLLCAPGGQTVNIPGKKDLHTLIVEMLDKFAAERREMTTAEIRELLAGKFGYPVSAPVPYRRTLRASAENNGTPELFVYSRFGLETDPGIITTLLLRTPPADDRYFEHIPALDEAILYVPHLSSADELRHIAAPLPVFAVDVRGIGETMSNNCDFYCRDDFFTPYGEDYHYNSCAIMFGESTIHERLRDLFGAVASLKDHGVKKLHLYGRGQGAIIALFAAVLSEEFASVKLFDAPESFDSMARARVTRWPHALMPRGILKYTDLPVICRALQKDGKLEIVNTVDGFFRTKW
ncbi:MAG: acetylxylan esterase [Lentisphaeria bacterium]|nr:acetylxylan esterase [Lentisphaeria bacterium]